MIQYLTLFLRRLSGIDYTELLNQAVQVSQWSSGSDVGRVDDLLAQSVVDTEEVLSKLLEPRDGGSVMSLLLRADALTSRYELLTRLRSEFDHVSREERATLPIDIPWVQQEIDDTIAKLQDVDVAIHEVLESFADSEPV